MSAKLSKFSNFTKCYMVYGKPFTSYKTIFAITYSVSTFYLPNRWKPLLWFQKKKEKFALKSVWISSQSQNKGLYPTAGILSSGEPSITVFLPYLTFFFQLIAFTAVPFSCTAGSKSSEQLLLDCTSSAVYPYSVWCM